MTIFIFTVGDLKQALTPFNAATSLNAITPVDSEMLNKSLEEFRGAAIIFADICIHENKVRTQYLEGIKRTSDMILEEVLAKKIPAQEGVKLANVLRNVILAEQRAASTPAGRELAKTIKQQGKTLEESLNKYAKKRFKSTNFNSLTPKQKSIVYLETIRAAGRDNFIVTATVRSLAVIGRVCVYITVGLALSHVIQAENPTKEIYRQTAKIGGEAAGAYMGAGIGTELMSFGSVCGPGAPLCAAGIFLICLLVGAWAGDKAATGAMDMIDDELEEFLKWGIF